MHIVGGTITDFDANGISVGNASDVHISGVTLSNNVVGISLQSCSGCRVVDNQVIGRGTAPLGRGILVLGNSASTRISNNTVTGNVSRGI